MKQITAIIKPFKLEEVREALADGGVSGLTVAEVIAAHQSVPYSVALYGFAPGYAYLSGLPDAIRLPRKETAIRDVPAGSVIIAAGQCIVTTLTIPTDSGWGDNKRVTWWKVKLFGKQAELAAKITKGQWVTVSGVPCPSVYETCTLISVPTSASPRL